MLRRDRPSPGPMDAGLAGTGRAGPASPTPLTCHGGIPARPEGSAAQSLAMWAAKPLVCQVSPVSVIA